MFHKVVKSAQLISLPDIYLKLKELSETALLHLASLLVRADLEDAAFGTGAFLVDPAAWQLTGLTEEHCLQARQTAAQQFGEVAESISI